MDSYLISIHALLAESDVWADTNYNLSDIISIHALLAESDSASYNAYLEESISIHALLAESDSPLTSRTKTISAISIHALLAESDPSVLHNFRPLQISIHALLAESDPSVLHNFRPLQISIHALLAESDSKSAQNSGALLRIWNKFYGDCIFMLTGKAVFYPFCPCFFHIFWCEGTGNFMIAFPSH